MAHASTSSEAAAVRGQSELYSMKNENRFDCPVQNEEKVSVTESDEKELFKDRVDHLQEGTVAANAAPGTASPEKQSWLKIWDDENRPKGARWADADDGWVAQGGKWADAEDSSYKVKVSPKSKLAESPEDKAFSEKILASDARGEIGKFHLDEQTLGTIMAHIQDGTVQSCIRKWVTKLDKELPQHSTVKSWSATSTEGEEEAMKIVGERTWDLYTKVVKKGRPFNEAKYTAHTQQAKLMAERGVAQESTKSSEKFVKMFDDVVKSIRAECVQNFPDFDKYSDEHLKDSCSWKPDESWTLSKQQWSQCWFDWKVDVRKQLGLPPVPAKEDPKHKKHKTERKK